ncbi:MAG TPA: ATP-grasp domain-containing protein, partial [Thermoanaerobaculia bacterium]|nr:ATP-grasp domain-containing protein [Thermoanaerobaculia bacterium]
GTGSDFVFVNPDPELEALATIKRTPCRPHPIPSIAVTAICLDKAATVEQSRSSRDFPRTFPIHSSDDVERAFSELDTPIWLRATIGPGGRGSLPVSRPEEVDFWTTYWQRQGRRDQWVLQEYLPGRNLNWTGLFHRGTLLASAAMERLRYFLGNATVSGVSGQVALCATVDPQEVEEVARRVVTRLEREPSGLYSVDLRLASDGNPKVTEINPRLAGRPWLYTNAGINLPLASVRALTGLDPGDALDSNGFRIGLHLYRQLDVEPIFGTTPPI